MQKNRLFQHYETACFLFLAIANFYFAAKYLSASRAAIQPVPAAVIA